MTVSCHAVSVGGFATSDVDRCALCRCVGYMRIDRERRREREREEKREEERKREMLELSWHAHVHESSGVNGE